MERVTGVWGSCGIGEVVPAGGLLEVNLKMLLDGKGFPGWVQPVQRHGGFKTHSQAQETARSSRSHEQTVLSEGTSSWR